MRFADRNADGITVDYGNAEDPDNIKTETGVTDFNAFIEKCIEEFETGQETTTVSDNW